MVDFEYRCVLEDKMVGKARCGRHGALVGHEERLRLEEVPALVRKDREV